jgi:hypothetical protein
VRHHHILFAILLVGTLSALPTPAKAQCEGEALRLCGGAIPDRERVKSCLLKNLSGLSEGCRSQFREGRNPRRPYRRWRGGSNQ